jgi:hypothetical protein
VLRPKVQIGGKFSRCEQGIFALKARLIAAGVEVSHPIGTKIRSVVDGIALSVNLDELGLSLFDLEIDYFRKLKSSSLHIVHNRADDKLGHVGRAAATELGYALLNGRNVCLIYGPPKYGPAVSQNLADVISRRLESIHIERIDLLSGPELLEAVFKLCNQQPDYHLSARERQVIKAAVSQLLRDYAHKRFCIPPGNPSPFG